MKHPRRIVVLLLAALSIAACSSERSTVRIDGSSTVFPITEAVAEEFMLATSDVRVNVGFSGTGAGFEKSDTPGKTACHRHTAFIYPYVLIPPEHGYGILQLQLAIDDPSVCDPE